MKALCQEYRNGARRNEQRNGENDTYRFQRRHNGQRDHAQQPIMQPSRMQTAYLRLLIIKAEQQKSRHFTLITSVTSPAQSSSGLYRRWLSRACRRKEYGQDVRLV